MNCNKNIILHAGSISKEKGGASFYIVNIIRGLAKIDTSNNYIILCSKTNKNYFNTFPKNFKVVECVPLNTTFRLIWEQLLLPFLCVFKLRASILFCPNYTSPIFHPFVKTVTVIHDCSFYAIGHLYPRSRRIFKHIITLSTIFSSHIISVSHRTKEDILKYTHKKYRNKIHVTQLAADERFVNVSLNKDSFLLLKKKYNLPDKYILFVGFWEPRKNLQRLLQAFQQIKNDIPHSLVIVGGKGWWYETMLQEIEEKYDSSRITLTGYVPDEELAAFYYFSDLYAFVSLYEGFGISALEAVSCGTPVLASSNTTLPEVLGNAGIYVDPYKFDDIAKKMKMYLTDKSLQKTMPSACLEVAGKYSWTNTSTKTLSFFKEIL